MAILYRFLFPNVSFEPEMEFSAGKLELIQPGVDERYKSSHGVWIVKQEGIVFALSTICTHLGCIPNWTLSTQSFECPCHGSGYYTSGVNFKGPAPRSLERYGIALGADGEVIISKNMVYRSEKGQWSNSNSFLVI